MQLEAISVGHHWPTGWKGGWCNCPVSLVMLEVLVSPLYPCVPLLAYICGTLLTYKQWLLSHKSRPCGSPSTLLPSPLTVPPVFTSTSFTIHLLSTPYPLNRTLPYYIAFFSSCQYTHNSSSIHLPLTTYSHVSLALMNRVTRCLTPPHVSSIYPTCSLDSQN